MTQRRGASSLVDKLFKSSTKPSSSDTFLPPRRTTVRRKQLLTSKCSTKKQRSTFSSLVDVANIELPPLLKPSQVDKRAVYPAVGKRVSNHTSMNSTNKRRRIGDNLPIESNLPSKHDKDVINVMDHDVNDVLDHDVMMNNHHDDSNMILTIMENEISSSDPTLDDDMSSIDANEKPLQTCLLADASSEILDASTEYPLNDTPLDINNSPTLSSKSSKSSIDDDGGDVSTEMSSSSSSSEDDDEDVSTKMSSSIEDDVSSKESSSIDYSSTLSNFT